MKIKLRAYDHIINKMIPPIQVEEHTLYDIGDFEWTVMRSTGMKDSRKKEIFEGDIIQFKYTVGDFAWEDMDAKERKANSEINGEIFTGVVKQKMIEPCNLEIVCESPLTVGTIFFPIFYAKNSSKVLGNIHENPELLKK